MARAQVRLPRERRPAHVTRRATAGAAPQRARASGAARDVLLNYMRDGDRFVVFASHAGEDRDPPWWLDLRDAGEAEILVDGKRLRVRAREAQSAEGDRLWSEVKGRDDAFIEYERRTARRIAVVMLEPA
ncbi:MAG TPA: nitroreductase/quinone reductase family protein [Candidatus Limnocylindria bacterium]